MSAVDKARWPSLAQDLALMSVPNSPIQSIQSIFSAYGITDPELRALLNVPEFQGFFRKAYEQLQEQGVNAGPMYKFSTLSQALAEKLFRQAVVDEMMEAKDMIKLFELLLKAAGFMNPPKETAQVNTQVNVGVHLPLPTGLSNPKLKHLEVSNG